MARSVAEARASASPCSRMNAQRCSSVRFRQALSMMAMKSTIGWLTVAASDLMA